MHTLAFETEFRDFAVCPGSVVDAALLVSRLVRPETDEAWCRNELARLAALAGPAPAPQALLAALRAEGFAGAVDYYRAENSALDYVLRERRGIPISLAAVLIGVAGLAGVRAVGVNFPGHFLVELEGELVDPFAMSTLDEPQRLERLMSAGVPPAEAFKPATPIDVLLRMLNNLRALAGSRGDHLREFELGAYQLLLSPAAALMQPAAGESRTLH